MKQAHFHCQFGLIKRSSGHSVVKKAAYNTRSNLYRQESQEQINYTVKQDLLSQAILAPKNAQKWVFDREQLYNKVEAIDKRSNSQLGRTIEIGLMHQLTLEQNKELLEQYLNKHFVSQGMVADYAIHAPDKGGDERNIHAHVILSMRQLDGAGFNKKKERSWNDRKLINQWREAWAIEATQTFKELDLPYYLDHRSLKEQGKDQLPQRHEGKQATHLKRRKGVTVSKVSYNELIAQFNQLKEQTKLLLNDQLLSKAEKQEFYTNFLEQSIQMSERAIELEQAEADYWIQRRELEGIEIEREQLKITEKYLTLRGETLKIAETLIQQLKLDQDSDPEEDSSEIKSPEKQHKKTDYENWLDEAERSSKQQEQKPENTLPNDDYEIEEPPDLELDRKKRSTEITTHGNSGNADHTELEALTKAQRVREHYKTTQNKTPKSAITEYRLKLAEVTAKFKPETVAKHFHDGTPSAMDFERLIRDYLRSRGFNNQQIKQAMRRASPALYKKSKEQANIYAKRFNNYLQKIRRQQQQIQKQRQQKLNKNQQRGRRR